MSPIGKCDPGSGRPAVHVGRARNELRPYGGRITFPPAGRPAVFRRDDRGSAPVPAPACTTMATSCATDGYHPGRDDEVGCSARSSGRATFVRVGIFWTAPRFSSPAVDRLFDAL